VELLAVSTGAAIAYGAGLWVVLIVAPATITALKGQWLLLAAGFITLGIVWWIATLRLARPRSWWARHRYGRQSSLARFGAWASRAPTSGSCDRRSAPTWF
jgi:hypothetical protein